MEAHCTTSKKITWKLVNVRAFYVPVKNGHAVSCTWEYTLTCPGVCSPGERCVPQGRTGRTTVHYNLRKARNRSLSPAERAVLKTCYQQSRAGFLDCAKSLGFGIGKLVDDSYLTKEPDKDPGSCRCIEENLFVYNMDDDPTIHIDFKRDQKSEEEFWKQFIAIDQYSIDW